MANSINWRLAQLAANITSSGLVESDGLDHTIPRRIGFLYPSSSYWNSSWPDNLASLRTANGYGHGSIYNGGEDADFEGALAIWDSVQSDFLEVSFTEWGGTQGVQAATITEITTPDYNTQYKDIDVVLRAPDTADKQIGEDPQRVTQARSWSTSGTSVALSSTSQQQITVYNPDLQGNTDGSTTVSLTLTDNQGQTDTGTFTISWRANRNPTAPTGLTFNKTQPVNPGTSVTVTASGATDPEGDAIYYQFESVGTTPTLGISTSWSTSTSRSFTVPEYDDGSDNWSVSVRVRTSRNSSGDDPSAWYTTTFTGKRPRRYSDYFVIQSITEYNRSSTNSAFNPGNISYPSNIQEGDLLFLSFGAYTPPGNVNWNSVTMSSGRAVAIKGDDLNNSGNTAYSTSNDPNTYRSAEPDIVSSAGWERAYNTATNSSSTVASTYRRQGGNSAHVYNYDGNVNLAVTPTIDQFYKITTGSESGTIPLWDWTPTSSNGYAHAHMGEVVFVTHLRLYDEFNNAIKISEVSQIYANNNAWNRQQSILQTSSSQNFEYTFTHNTIGGNGCTDDCIFFAQHVLSNGDYNSSTTRYDLWEGGDGTFDNNHGLYRNTADDYVVSCSGYVNGDNYSSLSMYSSNGGSSYSYNLADYNIDDYRKGRVNASEVWSGNGLTTNNDAIGTTGGSFIYGLHATNISCLRKDDVKRITSRDFKFRYSHNSTVAAGETNNGQWIRHSHGGVAILQLKGHDTLYDGAY